MTTPGVLALFCAPAIALVAAEPATLRLAQTIPLPGVSGRFDHFAVDLKNSRLFVAALGNDTVEVMDVGAGQRLRTLAELHKPQGVAYLSDRNKIVVASGGDGTVKFFDGVTYQRENIIESLDDADNVRYDSAHGTVYVGYGDGALAVIDAASAKQTATIKLTGHPESFQLEQKGPRIFVNVPDDHLIAVVDRQNRRVIATWPMAGFRANFPMALDEANHRLFVGCRSPARLLILDTDTGQPMADLAISGDTDDLFYDESHRRIYLSCGAGTVDVIDQRDADHYSLRERIPTSPGARTAYFSSDSATLFVAVPARGSQGAEIRTFHAR